MAVSEAKRREVLQLLREYRAFKTAFGGAMATEDSHLRSAEYASGGLVMEGAYYDRAEVVDLKRSFDDLEAALVRLGTADRQAYYALIPPYLSDPADPSMVDDWRKKTKQIVRGRLFIVRHERAVANHDVAIELLAMDLSRTELYVKWPKRMTSQQADQIEKRNAELYETYQHLREEGRGKTRAVEEAATRCDYSRSRAFVIVGLREES